MKIKIAKWLAEREMLPYIIEAKIIEERDKAINIQYENIFYWLPKRFIKEI